MVTVGELDASHCGVDYSLPFDDSVHIKDTARHSVYDDRPIKKGNLHTYVHIGRSPCRSIFI